MQNRETGKDCRQHTARPSRLMDEMAYRGHKRCDIDGQSDIASLILPPLSLTHTHAHTYSAVSLSLLSCVFSVLL